VSGTSTHTNRLATIKQVYQYSKVIIDPHTADGVSVARELKGDAPVICFATALPVKFEATIQEALGFVPERPARFVDLEKSTGEGFTVMDASVERLKVFLHDTIRP